MPRITSRRTRSAIFVVEESTTPDLILENLALYLPDGTPMDLTKDATRMLWRGAWSETKGYDKNDVVIDEGDLFILEAASLGPGGISPHEENTASTEVTLAFPGEGGGTAYPLVEGGRLFDPYVGFPRIVYFNLISSGTLTAIDTENDNEFIEIFDSAGVRLATNFGSGFGSPLVRTAIAPGRYYIRWQEAVVTHPLRAHLQLTLTEGAQFFTPVKMWDVLFRASSGPAGPTTSFLNAWKGAWAAGAYTAGSVVRYSSALYIATTAASSGDEPGVSSTWQLLIQGV